MAKPKNIEVIVVVACWIISMVFYRYVWIPLTDFSYFIDYSITFFFGCLAILTASSLGEKQ
jgi:hypothetical protein